MSLTSAKSIEGHGDAGFALVEVLISLTLLALIASSSTLLLLQLRRVQVVSNIQAQTEEVASYRGLLRTLVSDALRGGGSRQFVGNAEEVRFRSLTQLGPLPLGWYEFILSKHSRRNANSDLYKIDILRTDSSDSDLLMTRVLPQALANSNLSYFGSPPSDASPTWHRNWEESFSPLLVRLEFIGEVDNPQTTLVVGP